MSFEVLEQLSNAIGVSGKEDAVRAVVLNAIRDHATDIRIDPLGGVSARKPAANGGDRPLRVMIAAHMDEIGFMVTGIDGDGLIRFAAVGGIDDRILPGLRVKVGERAHPGVILWTPIHQNRDQNVVKLSNLRIDIGAGGKDEASGKVRPGDVIAFDSTYGELGAHMLRGKAFDDRAGCALLVDVLRGEPYPVEVLGAFTVQEEIGLRGAMVAANALQPDVAFVLEGTTANDLPNPQEDPDAIHDLNPTSRVGAGPVLTVIDRSMIVNPRLLAFLKRTAEREGIPYQLKTQPGGGTDGGAIHLAGEGVPTAVISLPCRYIHSPTALLHRDDYANALRLVKAALSDISPDTYRY